MTKASADRRAALVERIAGLRRDIRHKQQSLQKAAIELRQLDAADYERRGMKVTVQGVEGVIPHGLSKARSA